MGYKPRHCGRNYRRLSGFYGQICCVVPAYRVLTDDNRFSADIIQGICYSLAFLLQLDARSMSIPAPARLAEDFALRGCDLFRAA